MANILVIAAHSDDEALGCGGTMAKHAQKGDSVRVVFMTNGVGSRTDGAAVVESQRRMEACRSACAILGASDPHCFDFPDNAMDSIALLTVAKAIESCIGGEPIDIVYTHHAHDLNVDHRVTHEAVMTAFRPQPGGQFPTILCFETMSSTEWRMQTSHTAFVPNWFEDITGTLNVKLRALQAYDEEMRAWPHSRSIEALTHLARWRGACIGRPAAEAFSLARKISD